MEASPDSNTTVDKPDSQGYNRALRLFEPPHLRQILKIKDESIIEVTRKQRRHNIKKAGGCFEQLHASHARRIDRILVENMIY